MPPLLGGEESKFVAPRVNVVPTDCGVVGVPGADLAFDDREGAPNRVRITGQVRSSLGRNASAGHARRVGRIVATPDTAAG